MKVKMGITNLFFDRAAVLNVIGKARAKILLQQGRMVRKRAQASLKYGEEVSTPGSPPRVHKTVMHTRTSRSTGKVRRRMVSPLREYLYFAYNPQDDNVVVGPTRYNYAIRAGKTPGVLEYGGTTVSYTYGKRITVRIAARPYMAPALAAEAPGFAVMWRGQVRKR